VNQDLRDVWLGRKSAKAQKKKAKLFIAKFQRIHLAAQNVVKWWVMKKNSELSLAMVQFSPSTQIFDNG
jgi:hypothetical protein